MPKHSLTLHHVKQKEWVGQSWNSGVNAAKGGTPLQLLIGSFPFQLHSPVTFQCTHWGTHAYSQRQVHTQLHMHTQALRSHTLYNVQSHQPLLQAAHRWLWTEQAGQGETDNLSERERKRRKRARVQWQAEAERKQFGSSNQLNKCDSIEVEKGNVTMCCPGTTSL